MRRLRCAWAAAPAAHFSECPIRRGATRSRARSGGAAIALAVLCMSHLLYFMSALSPSFPGGLRASAMAADGHLRASDQHHCCCCLRLSLDTLAERLRRRPAKPMGSPRVGSNPTGVVSCAGCAAEWWRCRRACSALHEPRSLCHERPIPLLPRRTPCECHGSGWQPACIRAAFLSLLPERVT